MDQAFDEQKGRMTYAFQRPHFAQNTLHVRIVLALQLVHHRIAVLSSPIRRRWSVATRSA